MLRKSVDIERTSV